MKIIKDFDLLSPKWLDIIFEKRNKQYGAYELRNDSSNRHLKALIIVFIVGLLAIFLPKIVSSIEWVKPDIAQTGGVKTTEFQEPETPEKQEVQVEYTPPPPILKEIIQVTQIIVDKDENVKDENEQKTQKELTQVDVDFGGKNQEGSKDVDAVHPGEVEKIAPPAPKDTIYKFVEKMPEFPGGAQALNKWLNEHIEYPYTAQEMGVQGKVYVSFIVRIDGSIDGVKIAKGGAHESLNKEAIRLVKSMPKWMPGRQNGNAVSAYFTLPVSFVLK